MSANHWLASSPHPFVLSCCDVVKISWRMLCSQCDSVVDANSTNQPAPVAVPAQGTKPGYIIMLCSRGKYLHVARSLNSLGTVWEPLINTGLKLVPGPTPGVHLATGRLVVAAYGQALLSDDGGTTWRGSASYGGNGSLQHAGEGEVAIAPNGSLLANYRQGHPYKRLLSFSNNGGETCALSQFRLQCHNF
eukprot:SAG31_NODE_450_length_15512_cov_5.788555_10_plen_191_part_00